MSIVSLLFSIFGGLVHTSYSASVCRTFGMLRRDASCWAREDLPAAIPA